MKKIIISSVIGMLMVPIFAVSAPAPKVIIINNDTNECSEFWAGDECYHCSMPEGWEPYQVGTATSCPASFVEKAVDYQCKAAKNEFCCTEAHSGGSGNCEDLVVNESTMDCAFIMPGLYKCGAPEGWAARPNAEDPYNWLCPSGYDWEDALTCWQNPAEIVTLEEWAKAADIQTYSDMSVGGDEKDVNGYQTNYVQHFVSRINRTSFEITTALAQYQGKDADYSYSAYRSDSLKNNNFQDIELDFSGRDLPGFMSDDAQLKDFKVLYIKNGEYIMSIMYHGKNISYAYILSVARYFVDKMEGIDPGRFDSDGDGVDDESEFFGGPYNKTDLEGVGITISDEAAYNRLKGKILLRVEESGEAYWVHPEKKNMYYLGRPEDAFKVMQEQGVGATTENIIKIMADTSISTGVDFDSDGLSDIFEDAVGTNPGLADSDGDGYTDKQEISGMYNPLVAGGSKLSFDNNFADKQKGKIFIQVEGNGEAWYINPGDSRRYFLGRPHDAFQVMRSLGLGISERDFLAL